MVNVVPLPWNMGVTVLPQVLRILMTWSASATGARTRAMARVSPRILEGDETGCRYFTGSFLSFIRRRAICAGV